MVEWWMEMVERWKEMALEKIAEQNQVKRSGHLQAFAQEFSKRVKNPIHSWEIDAMLYGEDGLPKSPSTHYKERKGESIDRVQRHKDEPEY
jgi:hypothetical protein